MGFLGTSIFKYDLSTGKFLCQFQKIYHAECSVALLDGLQGRRLFVGCSNGDLLLVNSVTGTIIDKCVIHGKEVTGMWQRVSCVTIISLKRLILIGQVGWVHSIVKRYGILAWRCSSPLILRIVCDSADSAPPRVKSWAIRPQQTMNTMSRSSVRQLILLTFLQAPNDNIVQILILLLSIPSGANTQCEMRGDKTVLTTKAFCFEGAI